MKITPGHASSQKPSPAERSREDGGLDFEHTDIEDARRVLDDESISQFEVATLTTPGQWKRLRRASLPTDRALTGRAIDWLLSLPPGLRPEHLGTHFPRIANELALVWHEPASCTQAFERLLNDKRKGRQGFPVDVLAELVALQGWAQPF